VRTLVDTHAVIWWLDKDPRLSAAARAAISTATEALVSAGTLFEIAIKESIGKLDMPAGWTDELLSEEGFSLLPIGTAHANALRVLPFVAVDGTEIRDPFDRLLVAQAGVEGVPIVTRDPAIRAQGTPTIW
jgi:PIN domain nuclease of toxin-antitoxin system